MRVHRSYRSIPEDLTGAVVAIGNFDGVHRGHQAVIEKARRIAREIGAPAGVVTFEPHPREYFGRMSEPFRLTSFRTKMRLIESLGVDLCVVLPFRPALASLPAEAFAEEVLLKGLRLRHVVVGDNFYFGKGRSGTPESLATLGKRLGFGVTVMGPVLSGAQPYSSTQVRRLLKAGNPTRAALLLGRYWEIEGRVRHGAKRGRELNMPTANIGLGRSLQPAFGVYAVRAALGREHKAPVRWHAGVANIGISPMFSYDTPLLEVHLLDFDGDLYGRHLRVALVDYLRPEMRFDSLEILKERMQQDADQARATLAWEGWDQVWPASELLSRQSAGPEGD